VDDHIPDLPKLVWLNASVIPWLQIQNLDDSFTGVDVMTAVHAHREAEVLQQTNQIIERDVLA
jgi:hypothetical protein